MVGFYFIKYTILIVEGETEQSFIINYYLRKFNRTINADLIKIINVEGIHNVYGFAKGILELHNPSGIYAIYDNDFSEELREVIETLNINQDSRFIIGEKEFEDAFTDEVLFKCWKKYHEDCGRKCPEDWTIENLKSVREECCSDNKMKFSKQIKQLNTKGKSMTKPIFGQALAQYIDDNELPSRLDDLFKIISKY